MKLTELTSIPDDKSAPISSLNEKQLTELQTALVKLGYPAGDIDGKWGHNTRNAWAEFMADTDQKNEPDSIDTNSLSKLQQMLDQAKPTQPYDFSSKQGTIEAIKSECILQGIGLKTQIAYVLATADHETNHTFKPVIEAYFVHTNNLDNYLKTHLPSSKYYPYYGRGYVQLTWDYNYEKYGKLLGKDLLKHPELALEPEIALFVLVHGFKTGAFTGRKISDYINAHETDFLNARRCINGIDKNVEIAALAKKHLASL
jgi:predicted chitinase